MFPTKQFPSHAESRFEEGFGFRQSSQVADDASEVVQAGGNCGVLFTQNFSAHRKGEPVCSLRFLETPFMVENSG